MKRVLIVGSVAFAVLLAAPNVPAGADNNFHGYSRAQEDSSLGQYTGIRVNRADHVVTGQQATGCTSVFAGDPVYQTEWMILTDDGDNWLEIGTGHQCNDAVRYWYWGVGYLGGWFPQGYTLDIADGTSHHFAILDTGPNVYFYIDGVSQYTQPASTAELLQTGLESYSTTSHVTSYTHNALQRTINGGQTWVN